jgi:hypothetical protein
MFSACVSAFPNRSDEAPAQTPSSKSVRTLIAAGRRHAFFTRALQFSPLHLDAFGGAERKLLERPWIHLMMKSEGRV